MHKHFHLQTSFRCSTFTDRLRFAILLSPTGFVLLFYFHRQASFRYSTFTDRLRFAVLLSPTDFVLLFCLYLYRVNFFTSRLAPPGAAMLFCSLPVKSRKGSIVTYPKLLHSGFVHDVTDTYCWAQNCNACDCNLPIFQTPNFDKYGQQSNEKLIFLFHCYRWGP